jgi:hypothetical protein
VSTFFTLKCRRIVGSARCPDELRIEEAAALTRLRAKGALMHLIQDSFSQSHARRGARGRVGAPDAYVAKVVCLPATEFYDYEKQVAAGEDHAAADYPPSLDAATCRKGSTIDDPITASAKVLRLVEQHADRAEFLTYFRTHVLG